MTESNSQENPKQKEDSSPSREACASDTSSLNLINLCQDTVRIEAFFGDSREPGHGYQSSGVMLNDNGEIVTADHHITSPFVKEIDVMFANGEHRKAHVADSDPSVGLAKLSLNDDQSLPQPYKPILFAAPDSAEVLSSMLIYGYEDHSVKMERLSGVVGENIMISAVGESTLAKETPAFDRTMLAQLAYLTAKQGLSGAGAALLPSGALFAIVEFGFGERMGTPGKVDVRPEVVMTPIDKVQEFLARSRKSTSKSD